MISAKPHLNSINRNRRLDGETNIMTENAKAITNGAPVGLGNGFAASRVARPDDKGNEDAGNQLRRKQVAQVFLVRIWESTENLAPPLKLDGVMPLSLANLACNPQICCLYWPTMKSPARNDRDNWANMYWGTFRHGKPFHKAKRIVMPGFEVTPGSRWATIVAKAITKSKAQPIWNMKLKPGLLSFRMKLAMEEMPA